MYQPFKAYLMYSSCCSWYCGMIQKKTCCRAHCTLSLHVSSAVYTMWCTPMHSSLQSKCVTNMVVETLDDLLRLGMSAAYLTMLILKASVPDLVFRADDPRTQQYLLRRSFSAQSCTCFIVDPRSTPLLASFGLTCSGFFARFLEERSAHLI